MSEVVCPSFLVAWSASAMCFESSCTSAVLSHVALGYYVRLSVKWAAAAAALAAAAAGFAKFATT